MGQVQTTIDSIAEVPRAKALGFDRLIIPGRVLIKGRTYRDGAGPTPQLFSEWLAESREVPRTSVSPVGGFAGRPANAGCWDGPSQSKEQELPVRL